MGMTAPTRTAAGGRGHRRLFTFLILTTLLVAQLAGAAGSAQATDGWTLNRLVLEFADGSFWDSSVHDNWSQTGNQGGDVIIDGDTSNPLHISCSSDLTQDPGQVTIDGVTRQIVAFWLHSDNPGKGNPGDRSCTPLEEFPARALTVDKTMVDNRSDGAVDATFTFRVQCDDGTDVSLDITNTGTHTVDGISPAATCGVTETDTAGADTTTVGTSPQPTTSGTNLTGVPAGATVYFVNTFDDDSTPPSTVSITVDKTQVDDRQSPADESFVFQVTCDDETNEELTITGSGSGSVDGIAEGASCTVTETANGGADSTTAGTSPSPTDETDKVSDVDVGTEGATVYFVNTFDDDTPPPPANPDISLTKTAVIEDGGEFWGELTWVDGRKVINISPETNGPYTVTYEYVITNTGDVALSNLTLGDDIYENLHELGDGFAGGFADAVAATRHVGTGQLAGVTLAPGQSITVEDTYTLTDADELRGGIYNIATATGSPDEGDDVSDSDDERISITEVGEAITLEPAISLTKEAVDGVEDTDAGPQVTIVGEGGSATVTYSYVVANSGDDDLQDLTLVDDKLGDLTDELRTAVTAEFGTEVLPVGGSVTIAADHVVTAADFDGILLTNTADVVGVGVESEAPVTDSDAETVVLSEVLGVVVTQPNPNVGSGGSTNTNTETLPKTGFEVINLLLFGLLMAALGSAVLLLTPRRRDESG